MYGTSTSPAGLLTRRAAPAAARRSLPDAVYAGDQDAGDPTARSRARRTVPDYDGQAPKGWNIYRSRIRSARLRPVGRAPRRAHARRTIDSVGARPWLQGHLDSEPRSLGSATAAPWFTTRLGSTRCGSGPAQALTHVDIRQRRPDRQTAIHADHGHAHPRRRQLDLLSTSRTSASPFSSRRRSSRTGRATAPTVLIAPRRTSWSSCPPVTM